MLSNKRNSIFFSMVREHAVQLATVFLKRWTRKNDRVKGCRSVEGNESNQMKNFVIKRFDSCKIGYSFL
jgi:hypothetical protein